jgi:hypothetical protein
VTEEIASAPSWVEKRLDDVFATLPANAGLAAARNGYLTCLARKKAPAAPSDILGTEFDGCRGSLRRHLTELGLSDDVMVQLDRQLESLEAEMAEDS